MRSETSVPVRRRSAPVCAGRLVLTLVLCATPVAFAVFLFDAEHVFNPEWHPHAKFHGVQLAGSGVTLCLVGLWLLWRPSLEPMVSATAAASIPVLLWIADFYAPLVPGTDLAPDPDQPNTIMLPGGIEIYGNLLFATIMLVLCVVGLVLLRRRSASEDTRSV